MRGTTVLRSLKASVSTAGGTLIPSGSIVIALVPTGNYRNESQNSPTILMGTRLSHSQPGTTLFSTSALDSLATVAETNLSSRVASRPLLFGSISDSSISCLISSSLT